MDKYLEVRLHLDPPSLTSQGARVKIRTSIFPPAKHPVNINFAVPEDLGQKLLTLTAC